MICISCSLAQTETINASNLIKTSSIKNEGKLLNSLKSRKDIDQIKKKLQIDENRPFFSEIRRVNNYAKILTPKKSWQSKLIAIISSFFIYSISLIINFKDLIQNPDSFFPESSIVSKQSIKTYFKDLQNNPVDDTIVQELSKRKGIDIIKNSDKKNTQEILKEVKLNKKLEKKKEDEFIKYLSQAIEDKKTFDEILQELQLSNKYTNFVQFFKSLKDDSRTDMTIIPGRFIDYFDKKKKDDFENLMTKYDKKPPLNKKNEKIS